MLCCGWSADQVGLDPERIGVEIGPGRTGRGEHVAVHERRTGVDTQLCGKPRMA